MGNVHSVKSYMDSVEYDEKRCQCLNMSKGRNPFVTISRQTGAGGHTLAAAIVSEIKARGKSPLLNGWQTFDQELCKMVCEEPGLSASMSLLLKSEYHSHIQDMLNQLIVGDSPQDKVIKKIFHLIRTLATFGRVIIVEHGSGCLTRNLSLGIHIRLVASLPSRIRRMMKLLNVTEKKAKEIISEQDKAREKLVKTFFNRNINDPLLYDAVWNTDTVPVEEIARSVVQLIEAKACHCPHLQ